jgi:hypothetical protein
MNNEASISLLKFSMVWVISLSYRKGSKITIHAMS